MQNRSYKAGDVVFIAEPYAVVVQSAYRLNRCDHCLEKGERKCSACKAIVYCGRDCQKAAWRLHHRLECRCLAKHSPNVPSESGRLFLKLLFRSGIRSAGSGDNFVSDDPLGATWLDSAGIRPLKDLMSHTERIRADPDRMLAFSRMYQSVRTFTAGVLPQECLPSSEYILELFGRMVVNSFTLQDSSSQQIGSAMLLSASSLDHSCQPNVHAYFQSGKIVMKCISNVDRFDQLRVNYCSTMFTRQQRKDILLKQYYFDCDCPACSGIETNELKCSKSACQGVCLVALGDASTVKTVADCSVCGSPPVTSDNSRLLDWINRLTNEISISASEQGAITRRKALLNNPENPLHAEHRLSTQLYETLYSDCLCRDEFSEAKRIGESILLPARKRHLSAASPWQHDTGLLHFELGELDNSALRLRSALSHFEQAEAIFNVTVEPDASVLLQLKQQIVKLKTEILALEQI